MLKVQTACWLRLLHHYNYTSNQTENTRLNTFFIHECSLSFIILRIDINNSDRDFVLEKVTGSFIDAKKHPKIRSLYLCTELYWVPPQKKPNIRLKQISLAGGILSLHLAHDDSFFWATAINLQPTPLRFGRRPQTGPWCADPAGCTGRLRSLLRHCCFSGSGFPADPAGSLAPWRRGFLSAAPSEDTPTSWSGRETRQTQVRHSRGTDIYLDPFYTVKNTITTSHPWQMLTLKFVIFPLRKGVTLTLCIFFSCSLISWYSVSVRPLATDGRKSFVSWDSDQNRARRYILSWKIHSAEFPFRCTEYKQLVYYNTNSIFSIITSKMNPQNFPWITINCDYIPKVINCMNLNYIDHNLSIKY